MQSGLQSAPARKRRLELEELRGHFELPIPVPSRSTVAGLGCGAGPGTRGILLPDAQESWRCFSALPALLLPPGKQESQK